MLRGLVTICLAVGAAAAVSAQQIQVVPSRVLADEQATISVSGVQPGSRVTIRADLTDGADHPWASEAEFVADAQGAVDTAKQAPAKGSYRTASAMGLVWSMMPAAKDVHIYRPPKELAPQIVRFHLLQDGKEIGKAELEQLEVADGVRRIKVEGLLRGSFFVPSGEGKHPGVLVLGGSEGGMPTRQAAWLASRGYTALALCYFHCEGRPPDLENIPLEYFGLALGWMTDRPEVDAGHLAVMGTSRGGELALQLGSMYPQLKAVVAYVPANIRYPACCQGRPLGAWTWQGQPLAWAGPRLRADSEAMFRAQIAVEHAHGPILMIGGKDDGVWPSSDMVGAVAARLHANHFAYEVVTLIYPHAGHRAGHPEIIPAWHNAMQHPVSGRPMDLGGTPVGNAESTLDAIPKVLEFLHKSLQPAAE